MLSGNIPFAHIISDMVVMLAIIKGEKPKPPPDIIAASSQRQHLWKICSQCWNANATKRPSMREIVVCTDEHNVPT